MSNFLDICEKAIRGPLMSEKDFDMKLFVPKLNEMVRKYGIKYDRENPRSQRRQGGRTTSSRPPWNSCRRWASTARTRTVSSSSPKGRSSTASPRRRASAVSGRVRRPRCSGCASPTTGSSPGSTWGSGIVTTTEEMFTNKVEGYASIPEADSISIPALDSIRGDPGGGRLAGGALRGDPGREDRQGRLDPGRPPGAAHL